MLCALSIQSSGPTRARRCPAQKAPCRAQLREHGKECTLHWDFADRLQHVVKQTGGNQQSYYVYDGSGQRVRKVYEHGQIDERIYLGGVEIYRKRASSISDPVEVERATLHVNDDTRRVAMVETKTIDANNEEPNSPLNQGRWRYQLDNHLGSSAMEIDGSAAANVISYEEYHPYGSTAFHLWSSSAEVSAKRYRYTGKEKDEESGLYYHGARYYAAWLGRWTAADPAGLIDGLNLYRYSRDNPVRFNDPGGTESWLSAVVTGIRTFFGGRDKRAAAAGTAAGEAAARSSEATSHMMDQQKGGAAAAAVTSASGATDQRSAPEEKAEDSTVSGATPFKVDSEGLVDDPDVIQHRTTDIEHDDLQPQSIVLHFTNRPGDAQGQISDWEKSTNPDLPAAHFLVDKDGTVYQTASLEKTTYHISGEASKRRLRGHTEGTESPTGKPAWSRGSSDPNDASRPLSERYPYNSEAIGIEIVLDADDTKVGVWEEPTDAQVAATRLLVDRLEATYGFSDTEVHAHIDAQAKNPGEGIVAGITDQKPRPKSFERRGVKK